MLTNACKAKLFLGYLLLFVVILGLDQWTKTIVMEYFSSGGASFSPTPFINIIFVKNPGISFGFFNNYQTIGAWVITTITSAITIGLIIWLWTSHSYWVKFGLCLVVSGSIGNIIDRIRFQAVIDFLELHWQSIYWPAFNVADTAITCGVILIIGANFFLNKSNEGRCV